MTTNKSLSSGDLYLAAGSCFLVSRNGGGVKCERLAKKLFNLAKTLDRGEKTYPKTVGHPKMPAPVLDKSRG
jgi:hypothetical protein